MVKQENKYFTFKKLTQEDFKLLFNWFKEPHVSKWWPVPEENELLKKFLERIRSKDTFGYLILLQEEPIGYIQYYCIDSAHEKTGACLSELPKHAIGTDQFIGNLDCIGKGYGTAFIKQFITHIQEIEPTIKTIIVDPDPTNYAAIKCYEKVGFKRQQIYETSYGPVFLMRYDINQWN